MLSFKGKADYILSCDKHLLNLKKVREFKIITPAGFFSFIKK